MEATKMGHSQGLVTVDGLLPSFSSFASDLMFAGAYINSAMYFLVATMILVLVALLFVTFKYNTSHLFSSYSSAALLLHRSRGDRIRVATPCSTVPCYDYNSSCPSSPVHICHSSALDVQTADIWGRCDSQDTCLEERL